MKKIAIFAISFYQTTIGLFLGGSCRFYPSCSHYAKEAIEQKGAFQGLWAAIKRVLKCHPFSEGGYDPVS